MNGSSIVGRTLSERTLAMTVANTGFMVDRLGQDCAPLQFLRELTQNAIEAILATPDQRGEIVWDVDWDMYALDQGYKLCIIDNGVGMTGEEMVRYINALSSSVHEQSHEGNFGVGAKIAAATRNHEGLIYLSWHGGVGEMIHLWRDPVTSNYGLRQLEASNTFRHWGHVEDSIKPDIIHTHGTKVVLLGNSPDESTMKAPDDAPSPSRWISRYLNTRYFRFPEGITIRAREGWENPRTDKNRNVLRKLTGEEAYLDLHAEAKGSVGLTNATAHWWILRNELALSQNSGFVASSGHVAALYRDELYEMATGRGGVARLQNFGVIFGYNQVVIYVEPHGSDQCSISSNTARTHLLMNSEPLPWAEWMAEFRAAIPAEIKELMESITAGAVSSDHKKAIRERLREIRELFKLSRYRPSHTGDKMASSEETTEGGLAKRGSNSGSGSARRGGAGGRGGNVYALFLSPDGESAEEVRGSDDPAVQWITVEDGTRQIGFLEDRAAKYLSDQNLLQINGDFRGFADMIERWCTQYEHVPGARSEITDTCREWFEQALVETILGLKSLIGSREWTTEDIATSWSEEALTTAVMQRYHIDVAVKRALGARLGSLRERQRASAE